MNIKNLQKYHMPFVVLVHEAVQTDLLVPAEHGSCPLGQGSPCPRDLGSPPHCCQMVRATARPAGSCLKCGTTGIYLSSLSRPGDRRTTRSAARTRSHLHCCADRQRGRAARFRGTLIRRRLRERRFSGFSGTKPSSSCRAGPRHLRSQSL